MKKTRLIKPFIMVFIIKAGVSDERALTNEQCECCLKADRNKTNVNFGVKSILSAADERTILRRIKNFER